MDLPQLCFGHQGVSLVFPTFGSSIGQEMLGGGDHVMLVQELRRAWISLEAPHHGVGVGGHDLGVFGVALIRTTPPAVTRHRHGGPEIPVVPRHPDLAGRRLAYAPDQLRVVGGPESHVVGE